MGRILVQRSKTVSQLVGGLLAVTGVIAVLLAHSPDAIAISADYCGYQIPVAQSCYQGGGYLGWRYNQASHPDGATTLCAYSWTGSYYRAGSGCAGGVTLFANCSMLGSPSPATNASVLWNGGSGTRKIYGHADDSTNHC